MSGDIREAFAEVSRGDAGCAFAVARRGEVLVSLTHGAGYDERTLQGLFSVSKFVESLCIALLVERGRLDWQDRLSTHWPGFRHATTVGQLMRHRAGLPVFDAKLGEAEIFDLEARRVFLERQEPVAELVGRPAYHAVSRGLYSGELLRQREGRTMGAFLAGEIAGPLGLEIFLGLPERERSRLAAIQPLAAKPPLLDYEELFHARLMDPTSLQHRSLMCLDITDLGRVAQAELASSSGVANAMSLARLASLLPALLPRGLDAALQTDDDPTPDANMLRPIAYTQAGWARFPAPDGTPTYGWGGAGGQMVRWIPSLDAGCAFVTISMGRKMAMNDPRPLALLAATVAELS